MNATTRSTSTAIFNSTATTASITTICMAKSIKMKISGSVEVELN